MAAVHTLSEAANWLDRAKYRQEQDVRGFTPLMDLAGRNEYEKVKELLEQGANPNDAHLITGMTALMMAAKWGHHRVVRLLLMWNADPTKVTVNGETAWLLTQRYRPHYRAQNELRAALWYAAWHNDAELCERLFSQGYTDVDTIYFQPDEKVVLITQRFGETLNVSGAYLQPLQIAALRGMTNVCRRILEIQASVLNSLPGAKRRACHKHVRNAAAFAKGKGNDIEDLFEKHGYKISNVPRKRHITYHLRGDQAGISPEDSCSNVGEEHSLNEIEISWNDVTPREFSSSTSAAAGASDCSVVSWKSSMDGPKYFQAGTALKAADGSYARVELLGVGSTVLSAIGTRLEITKANVHNGGHIHIYELETISGAKLLVTATHRITTASGTRRAERLQIDDEILVTGARVEKLVDIRIASEDVNVYEFTFHPDEPVEAFLVPETMILSMGQRRSNSSGSSAVPAWSHRRAGMNKRIARQADRLSIPETDCGSDF